MAPGDVAGLYHRLTSYTSASEWRAPVEDPRVIKDFQTDVLEMFATHCKV